MTIQNVTDEDLDRAIAIAEQHSGFSKFHESYPPLFKRLWQECANGRTITVEGAAKFAQGMVANGWKDWAPSDRERTNWRRQAEANPSGEIDLDQFAEMSENSNYEIQEVHQAVAVRAGAHSKAEAGRQMAQAFSTRHQASSTGLPDGTTPKSEQSSSHCAKCEHQPMMQHVYCGPCPRCPKHDDGPRFDRDSMLLDYQLMCYKCAEQLGRCCACGLTMV